LTGMHGYGWGRERGGGRGIHASPEHIKMLTQLAKSLPRLPPPPQGVVRVAAGVEADMGVYSPLTYGIAHAPYLVLVDVSAGRLLAYKSAPNPLAQYRGGVGLILARWIIDNHVHIVLAGRLGRHAMDALAAKGVRVEPVYQGERLIDALRRLGLLA